MKIFLILIFSLLSIYVLIPEIWFRFISPKVLRRVKASSKAIFFTFDDGPHPVYTLQILDILEKNNVKATFFFLGKKVKESPEIVKLVKLKGHSLGSHGYSHRPIWILPPNKVREEFERTDEIIFSVLGERPQYIRPPWGGFNLSLVKFVRNNGRIFVLWSLDSRDWQRDRSVREIVERVLKRIRPGDIILFHDGRWDDISRKTVEALPVIIDRIKEEGYEILPLPQEIGYVRGIHNLLVRLIWKLVDSIFYKVTRIITLDDPDMVLSFSINKNRWKPVILNDGTILNRGDKFLEVHFLNDTISNILINHRSLMGASREIKRRLIYSFDKILRYLEENNIDVKAFHGVTVLYRIAELNIATIFDINPIVGFFVNLYEKLILVSYHPEGFGRLKKRGKLIPKSIWISVPALKEFVERHKRRVLSGSR